MFPFWSLDFSADFYIFREFVDPCVIAVGVTVEYFMWKRRGGVKSVWHERFAHRDLPAQWSVVSSNRGILDAAVPVWWCVLPNQTGTNVSEFVFAINITMFHAYVLFPLNFVRKVNVSNHCEFVLPPIINACQLSLP